MRRLPKQTVEQIGYKRDINLSKSIIFANNNKDKE